MKKQVLTLFFLFSAFPLYSQGFGEHPPGIDWKKFDTEHFEIIFPAEMKAEALRVANTIEYLYNPVVKNLNGKIPKTTLLLSNEGIISNGYVRLMPRMSEWFSTPPQNSSIQPLLGTGEWYNLLASHETRHLAQIERMNKGFTLIMYILLGDLGRTLMDALSMPSWVLEGDATGVETALSNSGRGRMPSFDMPIRALILEDIEYSYYKAWLGSYCDYYPNAYHLGYLLTTHIKREYGPEAMDKILTKTGKLSFWPFALTTAVRSATKKWAPNIYREAMQNLKQLWLEQLDGVEITAADILNKRKNDDWISYYYPQYINDTSVIAIKHGLGIYPKLVRIEPDGKEKYLESIFLLSPSFRVGNGKAVWNELDLDPRFTGRNYSEIVVYDIEKDKRIKITDDTRYFSPALSDNGKYCAVVEFDELRNCRLLLLDAETGNILKKFNNPENEYLSSLSWSQDNKYIAFTGQKFKGKALYKADISSGQVTRIIPHSWENLSDPVFFDNFILYNSPYSGIDNIYAVDTISGKKYQVTSSKYGAFNPGISRDRKKLVYNDYSTSGYNIATVNLFNEEKAVAGDNREINIEALKWKPIEKVEDRSINFFEPMIEQEQGGNIFNEEDIPKKEYEEKNYYPLLHLFNFHSWMPVPSSVEPGLMFTSNDILQTTQFSGLLAYNVNQKVPEVQASIAYAGIYPIFTAGISYFGRSSTYINFLGLEEQTEYWRELEGTFGITLPLYYLKGVNVTILQAGAEAGYSQIYGRKITGWDGTYMPVTYNISFQRIRQYPERNFRPAWAQGVFLEYMHTPFESDFQARTAAAGANLFFPGLGFISQSIFKHNVIEIQGSYEWQESDKLHFGSRFLFPRGYQAKDHDAFYKFSADYMFPLFYPDLALGQWLYFKRLRGDFFFDYGSGMNNKHRLQKLYRSVGGELGLDFHIFGWPFTANLGVRCSYLIERKIYIVEPTFNLGLF